MRGLCNITSARNSDRSSSPGQNFCGSGRVPWRIQVQVSAVANPKGETLLRDPEGGFWPDVYFLPWDFYTILNNVGRCRCSAALEAVMPNVD